MTTASIRQEQAPTLEYGPRRVADKSTHGELAQKRRPLAVNKLVTLAGLQESLSVTQGNSVSDQ
jgi:hypothetical protein